MSLADPKVTVLMPVYNGEKYLREALESVLNQTFTDFEFLIIDDGSTDSSTEIIRSYSDPRIRLVQNERNLKLIATLNKGLDLARGEYIARMDCDDISLPQRLARQVEFMEANPEIGVCGSWVKTIGERPGEIWRFHPDPAEIRAELFFRNPMAHPSVILRRSKLKEFNLYYNPHYLHAEDYGLWLECSKLFKLANIPEVLLNYRFTSTSVSHLNRKVLEGTLEQVHRGNLHCLGIDPGEREFGIHWRVIWWKPCRSKQELDDVQDWLKKLQASNASGPFPEPFFSRFVGEHWFAVCNASTALGSTAIRTFWTSPLRQEFKVTGRAMAKFVLKSLLKWG